MVNGLHCDTCNRDFVNYHAAIQHRNSKGHWECEVCCDTWWDEEDADDHMEQYNHYKDRYCFDCSRAFMNNNNYRQHRNSRMHRNPEIVCPFCKTGYVTASGLSHHLETGSCSRARNLNRETIYRGLANRDQRGLITNRLLDWPGDGEYSSNHKAWNGHAWECYLCPREFSTQRALDQHVNSPVHKSLLYHCPGRTCSKQFVTLAALFNHLESESCGFCRFQTVQNNLSNFVTGNRRLTFA